MEEREKTGPSQRGGAARDLREREEVSFTKRGTEGEGAGSQRRELRVLLIEVFYRARVLKVSAPAG